MLVGVDPASAALTEVGEQTADGSAVADELAADDLTRGTLLSNGSAVADK